MSEDEYIELCEMLERLSMGELLDVVVWELPESFEAKVFGEWDALSEEEQKARDFERDICPFFIRLLLVLPEAQRIAVRDRAEALLSGSWSPFSLPRFVIAVPKVEGEELPDHFKKLGG